MNFNLKILKYLGKMARISNRVGKIRSIIESFNSIPDPHLRQKQINAALKRAKIEMGALDDIFEFKEKKPGVYHGKRGLRALPLFQHEYVVVVPKNTSKLTASEKRQLRDVGGGQKGLVIGGYSRKKRLVSRLNEKHDLKAARKTKVGRKLTYIKSKDPDAAIRKALNVRKNFKTREYPSGRKLIKNIKGEAANSNTFARATLKELGHRKSLKTGWRNPGGRVKMDLYGKSRNSTKS